MNRFTEKFWNGDYGPQKMPYLSNLGITCLPSGTILEKFNNKEI